MTIIQIVLITYALSVEYTSANLNIPGKNIFARFNFTALFLQYILVILGRHQIKAILRIATSFSSMRHERQQHQVRFGSLADLFSCLGPKEAPIGGRRAVA
jgi:hypothetical protein